MPTLRTNIQKGKYSNYGSSIFTTPTKNTQYFKKRQIQQPTMRGSFPKAVRWSLDDEGVRNARIDYNRGLSLNQSAVNARFNARANSRIDASNTISMASFQTGVYSKRNFDGTAARKLAPEPKIEKPVNNTFNTNIHAVRGSAEEKPLLKTSALSPMFIMLAKVAAAVVVVIAVMAFIRVGITTATVSTGLNSQNLSKQIDAELVNKNALEVEDSTLGNTSRIRQAAGTYSLIAPAVIESITLDQDVLAYDEENKSVSLVESLNRVANKAS